MFDLAHQAVDATNGHAQGSTPLTAQQQQIVAFEMGLSTAQAIDFGAGSLNAHGGSGGPVALFNQPFFVGINDPLGQNPFKTPFNPVIFTLFTPTWVHAQSEDDRDGHHATHRASILRGQTLFNSHPINITGVGGHGDARHPLRRLTQPCGLSRCVVPLYGLDRLVASKMHIGRFPAHRIEELALISFPWQCGQFDAGAIGGEPSHQPAAL
jgi:hypothetical protein